MADVNANIGVQIDTSAALAELKNLQRELAKFHSSVAKGSAAATAAQKNLQTNLLNAVNATGRFTAQMGLVRNSTESFTHALETNKLSMREYFRFAGGATRTFGRLFKQEFDTIGKVAEDRVKKMQTQYIKMGRDASGAIKAMAITPRTLEMNDYATKTALAAQRQALFNQLVKQGSTNLLNFGKNTQWAGRQLMVGFTIPLAYFGTAASKTFMDLEAQAIKFKRVYGDMFTTTAQTNKALQDIQDLAKEFTKYGVAVTKTMEMAAQAAAMGKTGAELTAQVANATRLAVLGGVEQTQALETTISVTNAFGIAAEDLASKINFLNAVENQTVVSIEDLTEAIPKAGPVVKQLGGSVEDLAFFLTAMKEGGINASEGANALKSGLASLINPTKKASEMLAGMGINIKAIVEGNAGNLKEIVIDFAQALDTLAPLDRARAIEQLFGKFQFARLSTLFQNVTKDGTQASRVLQLAGASVEELAILAERELGTVENAIGVNFKESIEKLKLSIAPIGKTFLEAVTPIVQVIGRLLDKFNNLGDGTKKFIIVATTLVGGIGPILLMTFGLLANGIANIIKLFVTMRGGFLKLGTNTNVLSQQTQYLNSQQLEAATVAASLNQSHTRLTQSFIVEASAVKLLRQAYIDATIAATNFAKANPGMMVPGFRGIKPTGGRRFNMGTVRVPGYAKGTDSVPAMLTPGEAVVPEPIAQDNRFKPLIAALVSGEIAKYRKGTVSAGDDYAHVGGGRLTNINDIIAKGGMGLSQSELRQLQMYRDILVAANQAPVARSFGSLAYSFDPSLNKQMAKRGIPLAQFEQAWIDRPNKWIASGFSASQSSLVDRGILNYIKNSGVTTVTDDIVEKAFKNLPNEIKQTSTYRSMEQVHNKLGSYAIGRGLGSTPATSRQILEQAKKAGIIKDYRVEERISSKGKQAIKSLYVVTNDGKDVYLGRGSKSNRIYLADQSLSQAQKSALQPNIAARVGETILTKDGKTTTVTGQTGQSKPSNMKVIGGGPSDRRVISGTNIARIFPAGFKGPRPMAIGAEDGFNTGVSTRPGMAVSQIEKQFRAEQNSIRRKLEKMERDRVRLLKEDNKIVEDKIKTGNQQAPLTKEQLKQQKREIRAQRAQAVGRIAGPVGSVAGIGAMAAFATGNAGLGSALMGVSALSAIAPMLTNPIGIAVAAATTLAAGFFLLNKRMDDATKKQVEYINSITAGTKKMQQVGELTGKVGASQIAQKQRESGARSNRFRTGFDSAGNEFGTNFLASDIGKQIFKGFNDSVAKDGDKAAQLLATQLAAYISDGVLSAEQANSIARAIGINLGDMSIATNISGKLRELIGPDGQNLLKNPLAVRLNIITSQAQISNDLKNELNILKDNINRGTEYRDYVVQTAVANAKNLEIIKAQRDAQWQANQVIIDGLEKQKQSTIDKNKQLQLEQQIITAKEKQKTEDQILAQKSKQALKDAEDLYNLARKNAPGGPQGASGAFIDSLQAGIKAANKDNPFLNKFIEKTAALKTTQLEVQIDTAVLGGQLNIPTALKLLEMFAGTAEGEKKLKTVLETTLTTQDPGVFQTFMDIVSGKPIKSEIIMNILSDQGNFEDRVNVLNKLKDYDGDVINLGVMINQLGAKGLDQLVKDFNKIENIKGPITLDVVNNIKEITSDPDLNMSGLVKIWDKYKNATDEIKKTVIQEYIAIYKSIGDKEVQNFIQNEINKGTFGQVDPTGKLAQQVINKYKLPDGSINTAAVQAEIASTLMKQKGVGAPNTIPSGGLGDTGTGTRPTYLDDLLKRLKLVRDASINALGGLDELRKVMLKSGGDIKIFKGINQQLRDLGMNQDVIDFIGNLEPAIQKKFIIIKDGLVTITEDGKKLAAALNEAVLGELQDGYKQQVQGLQAQSEKFLELRESGLSAAEALEIVTDRNVALALSSGKTKEEIDNIINGLKLLRAQEIATLKVIDPAKQLEKEVSMALEYYDVLEKEARNIYQPQIDAINKLIDANEKLIDVKQREIEISYDRPIAVLNAQSTILNHDLSLIDHAAEDINKKYDAQEKALSQIYDINEEIVQQEQRKITIADALTQGDIAAAAKALQDDRQASARAAQQNNSNILQLAREKELANLRSSSGLTRAQIEKQLYDISEQVYALEQKRLPILDQITKLQDANYNYQINSIAPLQKQLDIELANIDAQRKKWNDIQLGIDGAKVRGKDYQDILNGIEDTLRRMKDLWNQIGKSSISVADPAITSAVKKTDPNITKVDQIAQEISDKVTNMSPREIGKYGGAALAEQYLVGQAANQLGPKYAGMLKGMFGMATGGMVPKYYVAGGYSKGTDTIPAMLSPGEFIVRKNAVDSFGVNNLNKINDGSYSGSSVYNYNLSVNVKSDANPNDIARTVISQIKQIDNQRIRTQRGA